MHTTIQNFLFCLFVCAFKRSFESMIVKGICTFIHPSIICMKGFSPMDCQDSISTE